MANSRRHYFLDFKQAENSSKYIKLTRSEEQPDGSYHRWSFIVFEDHLAEFIQAFAELFQSAAYQGVAFQTVKDIAHEVKKAKGIKAMAEELRPREKLAAHGAGALQDTELLAILLGSGLPGENAIDLAGKILATVGGSFNELSKSTVSSLCRIKGMGMAKACSVLAAIELGGRINVVQIPTLKIAT
ncbi:hypothetical protein OQZ33_17100 [Pedobacter sp. MC2016-05]|uniref:UPF0758 domain-containing protein n=1 Tax=Pedobacter sp. MC2016-05 TaxID=2994474 RepID=UPI002245FC40|nr:UPF0758 domain-containing protein [Pedobacter sp. MC2016-05]MCX2476054.1 hypothetical protein [Pedobacter sp. MC2016-05]